MGLVPARDRQRARSTASDITPLPPHARVRAGIGYVPQGREIFPRLTVEENLQMGLRHAAAAASRVPERIFELFPVLQADARRGAAATSPAASSSSSPSAARWPWGRGC